MKCNSNSNNQIQKNHCGHASHNGSCHGGHNCHCNYIGHGCHSTCIPMMPMVMAMPMMCMPCHCCCDTANAKPVVEKPKPIIPNEDNKDDCKE